MEVISVRGISAYREYGSKGSAFASELSAFDALLSPIIGINIDNIGLSSIQPLGETDIVDQYVSSGYNVEFSVSISIDCMVRSVALGTTDSGTSLDIEGRVALLLSDFGLLAREDGW
jgi:hypothetical protein